MAYLEDVVLMDGPHNYQMDHTLEGKMVLILGPEKMKIRI